MSHEICHSCIIFNFHLRISQRQVAEHCEKQAGDKVEAFLAIHVELTLSGHIGFASFAVTVAQPL